MSNRDARLVLVPPGWSYGSLPARSASLYAQAIDQFDLDRNPYFQPEQREDGGLDTFCNLAASMIMEACGARLPHFVPWEFETSTGLWKFRELGANSTNDWLNGHLPRLNTRFQGPAFGWQRLRDMEHAALQASSGFPTVGSWKNPEPLKSGHIVVVRPSPEAGPLRIAQAGLRCFNDGAITDGFSAAQVKAVQFFSFG